MKHLSTHQLHKRSKAVFIHVSTFNTINYTKYTKDCGDYAINHKSFLVVLACSPSPLIPLRSRERGFGWCWTCCRTHRATPCGYCLEASMTAGRLVWLVSPSPLIPLPSRERGILSVVSSCCHPALHLWIADQVRNDGMRRASATSSFPRRRESTGWGMIQGVAVFCLSESGL